MHPLARTPRAARRALALLGVLLLSLLALSLLLGRYPNLGIMPLARLLDDPLAQQLVWNLRLPRLLAAVLIGMSLAAAGVVFQMVFSNPLVEPGFLGVSQAAAFGAALAIIALGAAGGPKIISQVVLELVSLLDLGMSPKEALAQPRIHHQWSPDELTVEKALPRKLQAELARRGHKLRQLPSIGVSQIVARSRDGKGFVGAADPRAGGKAAGW